MTHLIPSRNQRKSIVQAYRDLRLALDPIIRQEIEREHATIRFGDGLFYEPWFIGLSDADLDRLEATGKGRFTVEVVDADNDIPLREVELSIRTVRDTYEATGE